MSLINLVLIVSVLNILTVLSLPERDIYHVITGKDEFDIPTNLDPVYYVGIYEEKPDVKSIPEKV